ncbi:MAG: insulinase family protein, partial [Oscillospiraceae bacterium]|nr:insulinase family protein [Oscillospiraceae bacterium]
MTHPTITQIAPAVHCVAVRTEQFKTARMVLQMALPLRREQAAQTAANALLPFLLHRCSAAMPTPRKLEQTLADLYGAVLHANVNKQGEAQILSIGLTAMDDRFALAGEKIAEECAALLLDLLFRPLINESTVELEKRLLIERMESEEGDKWKYAAQRAEALMCSDEAYGLNPLGEKDAVAALTVADVQAAWQALLIAAPMQLTMVSNAASEPICAALRERFATQQREPVQPQTQFIPTPGDVRNFREEQQIEQAKLMIGFRAGVNSASENDYALRVAVDLFGGGAHSKLFLTVREKLSLCYHVSAQPHRYKGLVMVRAGIDTEKFDEAREAILDMLAQLQTGDFTDEDLATSQRSMCDSYTTYTDLPETLAAWYGLG